MGGYRAVKSVCSMWSMFYACMGGVHIGVLYVLVRVDCRF